jgi:hypothetical protein
VVTDSYGNLWQNDNDDQVVTCRTTWLMEGGNAGYFSTDGSAPCAKCSVGTTNIQSRTSCDICVSGYMSVNGNGQAPCEICPVGSSNSDVASNDCPICDIGYYSPSGL